MSGPNVSKSARVLHIGKYYHPHVGGIESYLAMLCFELRKRMDVRVVVASDGRKDEEEIVDGVPVIRLGTMLQARGAPICPNLVRAIRQSDADLLHIHLPNPFAILAYFASGFKRPVVLGWHSDIIRQRFLGKVFEPIERKMAKRAAAIVAGSPDYIAYSPVLYEHRARCRVIPYGIPVEPQQVYSNEEISAIRRRYGGRLLLGVGRLVKYKGYEYLIQAMKNIRATLLLIGEGPERGRLGTEVRRLALEDRVVFLGRVEDTSIYYQACDVFVLPSISRNESFGIVQLEAMACGKPVVNTHLRSGVPFVSVHGLTGVTVPPEDPDALARAINVLLEDPDRCAAYGVAAKQRLKREFSLEKMVWETHQLYAEVLAADLRSAEMSAPVNPAPVEIASLAGF